MFILGFICGLMVLPAFALVVCVVGALKDEQ